MDYHMVVCKTKIYKGENEMLAYSIEYAGKLDYHVIVTEKRNRSIGYEGSLSECFTYLGALLSEQVRSFGWFFEK